MMPAVNLLSLSPGLCEEGEVMHPAVKLPAIGFGTLFVGMLGFLALDAIQHPESTKPPTISPKNETRPASIVHDYTRADYPKLFKRFGKSFPEINADRQSAAKIAANDKRCDVVTNVQIASRSPLLNRKYWVECGNLTRLRFDEGSLAKGEALTVQTEADVIRDGLIVD
jgi:hypothetical protein